MKRSLNRLLAQGTHCPSTRFTCRFTTKTGYKELDCIAQLSLPNIFTLSGRELLGLCDFCENAPIPLHKIEPNGIILWANKKELSLLGYEREEYFGHNISE
jgi:hypothetical protein